jgi:hypothetical protein
MTLQSPLEAKKTILEEQIGNTKAPAAARKVLQFTPTLNNPQG